MQKPSRAPAYCVLFPIVAEAAQSCGYAIGLHGSMQRDLDLIAAPWVDDAKSPDQLIEAIRAALCGFIIPDGTEGARRDPDTGKFVPAIIQNPSIKPHGRLAWNIHLEGGAFLDVSVMPRTACGVGE